MERDDARARGVAPARLPTVTPSGGGGSVGDFPRAYGRPAGDHGLELVDEGLVPDNASLRLLAEALGVELADLVAAYDGSEGRSWVFSDSELEAIIDRTVERTVRRVLAEHRRAGDHAETERR